MDMCLRVLKESNKRSFDSYSVRNSVLIISHITFRGCCGEFFSDNLSQNSCIPNMVSPCWLRRISQGDWRQSETAKYLASPQTSFGVRLSRIHFTNEPQRTSAGRLQNILNEQYTELTYTFKYVMNL